MTKKVHFDYSCRLLELGEEFTDSATQLFCIGGFGGNFLDMHRGKSVQSASVADVTCKRCLNLLGTREFRHIARGPVRSVAAVAGANYFEEED